MAREPLGDGLSVDREGYRLVELWSENRWDFDSRGNKTATAYYLRDPDGREFDVHAMRLDEDGNGIPAWEAGDFIFEAGDLAGVGTIAGCPVQCITPQSQMDCHVGYELPEKHRRDLERLYERFGVAYPEGIVFKGAG